MVSRIKSSSELLELGQRCESTQSNVKEAEWLTVLLCAAGLSLVESYPYEPEERGSDYVRLASIAAGDWAGGDPGDPAHLCPAHRAGQLWGCAVDAWWFSKAFDG